MNLKIITLAIALLAVATTAPAQSGLRISTQGNDVVLKWPSQSGDTFSVGHSPNLEPPWTFLAGNQPAATGSETTFTHSGVLASASRGFYFVEPAGRIAFPGRDTQGRQQLYTIKADGTDRRQLTFTNDNSMPNWSPDGARLVYVSRTPAPNLTIMDEDGGNQRTLVTGDAPDWGPNDQIAYTTGNPFYEIWVVDAAGGTPRQVTSGGSHGGRVHPSWSPDGKRLVYMQLTPQNPANDDTSNGCPALPFRAELWIINADGANPRLLTTTGFKNYNTSGQLINSADDANAPDWSPAGDHITFWSGQEQCYGQVWRINADGTGRTQLTKAPIPSHNDDPAWSPGGRQVLFTTDRNQRIETWVMNADGSNPRFLTESAPGPGPGDAAWQPAGQAIPVVSFTGRIAYGVRDALGVSQIVVAETPGEEPRMLTTGPEHSWFPAWSPDGARLLFTREVADAGGGHVPQVWVMNADGSLARALVTTGISMAGSWSPDGRQMAFSVRPSLAEGAKIWIADADGGNRRQLTDATSAMIDENVPRWSPDGTRIVFTSNRRGLYEIWVAEVATGALTRLTTAYHDATINADIEQKVPAWSSDGNWIAYWAGVEANDPRPELPRDVWVMRADGAGQKKLVGGDDPNWSPTGEYILHSVIIGGQPALGIVRPDGTGAEILFTVNVARPLQSSWVGDIVASQPAIAKASRARAAAVIPPVSNKGLKYFGFAAIDTGRTSYVDEISGFANVGQMVVYSPDESLAKRIAAFDRAGVKAIVHIEPILFERGQAAAPSGAKACVLRSDAEARWRRFVKLNKDVLTRKHVAAVYIFDEPAWNGVSRADFTRALAIVKSSLPNIPTAAIEAWQVVNRIMIPPDLDWVGWDRYDVADPEHDKRWLADLKTVRAARTRADQKIVIIANTHWKTYYKDAGVRPADMGAVAASSYRVAASDPDVVALIGYLWPGGLDPAHPGELGARDLPKNVQKIYRQIGRQIIRK